MLNSSKSRKEPACATDNTREGAEIHPIVLWLILSRREGMKEEAVVPARCLDGMEDVRDQRPGAARVRHADVMLV